MSNSTVAPTKHYPPVSDDILYDNGALDPIHPEIYPRLTEFRLGSTNSWTQGHPYDFYKRMREEAPVMWSPGLNKTSGFWSVSRYDDVKYVEQNPQIFSSQRGSMNMAVMPNRGKAERLMNAAFNSLINLDGDVHRELRAQQMPFFLPQYVEQLKERVGQKIDQLLDDIEKKGPVVDFAKMFSTQLPLFTLCEMLGVDEEDRPQIAKWMHYLELAPQFLTHPFRMFLAEPMFVFRFEKMLADMFDYGERVMADRIANPRQDLLTTIANASLDGKSMSQSYLDGSWLLIIFAGNDTTRNSLSGTIRLLTQFEDQRQLVLSDRSLIDRMSNESLRMTSPVMHMRRTAIEDTEIAGQRIAKDEKVIMWYGSANRDPSVFPNPDTFDLSRDNVEKHMAFGLGVHRCLGNRIAHMQLSMAYERILDRFPNIVWTGKQKIEPIILVHAISSLTANLYGHGGKRPTKVAMS
ncbi:cytochrome P450 family protein [Aequoribacter fuscus]|uniref:Cytochrome P450 family protein n=1 Tax=Aequoribacter fuscus TaxID=2518989 RepID=F3L2B2_9GAMM|nr:cytochrome P450 [Aequoribacter fuscus]EGG29537.1 cytochrome P450 family protein [Aequoribacter fuscus]QHJ87231.1 cytochrome P450 [Aequoribacter fuscus]